MKSCYALVFGLYMSLITNLAFAAISPAITKRCNKTCPICPQIQLVLEQNTPLPPVLIGLVLRYGKHYKEAKLFKDSAGDPVVREPLRVLYWEHQLGPTIRSIKNTLKLDCYSDLSIFRKLDEGVTYHSPIRNDLQLEATYIWYYKVVPSLCSTLRRRHVTW